MRNFAAALLLATTVAVAVLAFSAPAFAAPTDGRGTGEIEHWSTCG